MLSINPTQGFGLWFGLDSLTFYFDVRPMWHDDAFMWRDDAFKCVSEEDGRKDAGEHFCFCSAAFVALQFAFGNLESIVWRHCLEFHHLSNLSELHFNLYF